MNRVYFLNKYIGYEYSSYNECKSKKITEYYNYKKQNCKMGISFKKQKILSYDSWFKEYNCGEKLCYSKIKNIKEIKLDYVYDITTDDDNHNFLSNNFLVSNCSPYNADFDGDKLHSVANNRH